MASVEASKGDQVRLIGTKICRFANGSCLCQDRAKPICPAVKTLAIECWEAAHQDELSRADFNTVRKLEATLSGPVGTTPAPKAPKKVRRG